MPRKMKQAPPTLVVSHPPTRLPKDAGTKVKLTLKPNKKANYTAYQNITVKIGSDTYSYSEAWSMGAKGVPADFFSVPADLRDKLYYSDATIWLEKGGVDKTYKMGTKHDAETPWGTAKGRQELRPVPPGAQTLRRKTTLRWNKQGKLMTPLEKRIPPA
jgi:hypothetical protein